MSQQERGVFEAEAGILRIGEESAFDLDEDFLVAWVGGGVWRAREAEREKETNEKPGHSE